MKITKLVILFNKDKLLLGLMASIVAFGLALFLTLPFSNILQFVGSLILINIALSLFASYKLYDQSNLYKPEKLFESIRFHENDKAILLHASFDPLSRKLETLINPDNLKVYNIYGNRHEDEKSIKISNQVFPPHPKQINVDPTRFDDEANSVDYIFAITSAHEILTHEKRVKFFKEVHRIMKDDGTLILCEQMRNLINFTFFNIGAFHFVSRQNWIRAIHESGLSIKKEEKLTPWGSVFFIEKIPTYKSLRSLNALEDWPDIISQQKTKASNRWYAI